MYLSELLPSHYLKYFLLCKANQLHIPLAIYVILGQTLAGLHDTCY